MPVYTYRCESCGVQFDRSQNFSDAPLVRCPECGKKSLHKVYGPVGIVFKGSGFYSTDHRSPSGGSSRANKSEEGKEGKEASSKSGEAKSPSASKEKSSTTES